MKHLGENPPDPLERRSDGRLPKDREEAGRRSPHPRKGEPSPNRNPGGGDAENRAEAPEPQADRIGQAVTITSPCRSLGTLEPSGACTSPSAPSVPLRGPKSSAKVDILHTSLRARKSARPFSACSLICHRVPVGKTARPGVCRSTPGRLCVPGCVARTRRESGKDLS